MEKVKSIVQDKKIWLLLLIAIVFYGTLSKLNFMTDTYAVLETPVKDMTMHFITSGRFITAIAYAICMFFKLNAQTIHVLSFGLAIVTATYAMYKLYRIIQKEISNEMLSIIIAVLLIVNLFSIELFLYIEKGILLLSVLCCVLAFEQMTKYFEGNNKSIIYAICYMIIASFSYQGTVALFVALTLIWIVKYTKDVKSFLKNNIVTGFCYRNTSTYQLYTGEICFY